MDPAKGPQKVSHPRPHAFRGIDLHFAHPVAVILPRPLVAPGRHRRLPPRHRGLAAPFLRVDVGVLTGKPPPGRPQGALVGALHHPQPPLPTLPPHCAHHGGAVSVVGARAAVFVGPTPRRSRWVGVLLAFFPPHAATSRRFPGGRRVRAGWVASGRHWLAASSLSRAPSSGHPLLPAPPSLWSRLYPPPAAVTPPGPGAGAAPQSRCCSTRGKCFGIPDTATLSLGSGAVGATPGRARSSPPTAGRAALWEGNASLTTPRLSRRPTGPRLESPCCGPYHIRHSF